MKLIVVDDELAALNTFLPNIVDNSQVDCKMFMNNPKGALDYARANDVDAAFVDVCMPLIDGVELAERLIALRPRIKIVVISGYVQNEQEIAERLGDNFAGFCNKPYDGERLKALIASLAHGAGKRLFLRTFDAFDLFADGRAVRFSSAKSKELLALLTDANGSYVAMGTAICNLWADKPADLAKRLYRDAVCRLRMTLKEIGAEHLVRFERARAVIDTSAAECDYWTFLRRGGTFSGRYLPQYEWSIVTESTLAQLQYEG